MTKFERLNKWAIQLTNGKDPDPAPSNDEEKAELETLVREIKDIKASGGMVHLPYDLP